MREPGAMDQPDDRIQRHQKVKKRLLPFAGEVELSDICPTCQTPQALLRDIPCIDTPTAMKVIPCRTLNHLYQLTWQFRHMLGPARYMKGDLSGGRHKRRHRLYSLHDIETILTYFHPTVGGYAAMVARWDD